MNIKLNTAFGITETKTKKIFEFQNTQFAIVDFPCGYMNSEEPLILKAVVHLKSGVQIPIIKIERGDTLEKIKENSIKTFENLISTRSQKLFDEELDKFEHIN